MAFEEAPEEMAASTCSSGRHGNVDKTLTDTHQSSFSDGRRGQGCGYAGQHWVQQLIRYVLIHSECNQILWMPGTSNANLPIRATPE